AVFAAPISSEGKSSDSSAGVSKDSSEEREDRVARPEDTITVTGSLIRGSGAEKASPVTSITSEDIEGAGFKTVSDILMTASQSTGHVDTEMDMVGSTPNGQFVNLRGLG